MSEFRDLSRLPEDEAYWADLESKIMAELGPRVRGGVAPSPAWWAPLAEQAWGLGGFAIAASVAALLVVPARPGVLESSPAGLLRLPDDPALTAFVSAPAPPPLSTLVLPSKGSEQ